MTFRFSLDEARAIQLLLELVLERKDVLESVFGGDVKRLRAAKAARKKLRESIERQTGGSE